MIHGDFEDPQPFLSKVELDISPLLPVSTLGWFELHLFSTVKIEISIKIWFKKLYLPVGVIAKALYRT